MVRRIRSRRDRRGLLEGQRHWLNWHTIYFNLSVPRAWLSDEAAQRETWEAYRTQVLDEWFLDSGNMGSRPWAWWRWESPEPRNYDISEGEQLKAMGMLNEHELATLARWQSIKRNQGKSHK